MALQRAPAPPIRLETPTAALREAVAPEDRGRRRPHPGERPVPIKRRLVSLDVFRGFVIASMLLVNNMVWNASTPRQLMHARWGHGITFTDLILPWFVFVIGVTVPVSAAFGRRRPAGAAAQALRIVRRVALLLVLGIGIDTAWYGRLSIGMDVLQLLGLTYLVTMLLSRAPVWGRLTIAGALLAAHWAVLTFVPVPGYAPGLLQEDHNIIGYLNAAYLARYHLAGVLSVVPASALALLGTAAGDLLCARRPADAAKAAILIAAGVALTTSGALWAHELPLSKALWTSSYAVTAGGLGLVLLGVFYPLYETRRMRAVGFPFAVFGSNPIAAYVASGFLAIALTRSWHVVTPSGTVPVATAVLDVVGRHVGAIWAGWIYTGGLVVLWWLVCLCLYWKRVFLRV
jgi:predicted acyltransferase